MKDLIKKLRYRARIFLNDMAWRVVHLTNIEDGVSIGFIHTKCGSHHVKLGESAILGPELHCFYCRKDVPKEEVDFTAAQRRNVARDIKSYVSHVY